MIVTPHLSIARRALRAIRNIAGLRAEDVDTANGATAVTTVAAVVCLGVLVVVALAGCGPEDKGLAGPKVVKLNKERITIGEQLLFSGQGFLRPSQGKTLLEFTGAFYWQDESGRMVPEDVPSFTIAPVFDGAFEEGGAIGDFEIPRGGEVLRWNRFGPYVSPFGSDGRHTGLFKGTVTAVNIRADGQSVTGEPTDVAIEVTASVLITRLEPVTGVDEATGGPETADCGKPALRVFGGMPYVMSVETMGFTPAYFIYDIANINGRDDFTSFTHEATSNRDTIGDASRPGEMVLFNALGDDIDFAVAAIRVTAVDADNNSIATALPVPVVRPVRVQYDGNRELAEFYEPVPVYGPIVGGIGTEITYAETTTESRQMGVSVSFQQSIVQSTNNTNTDDWSKGYGVNHSTSTTDSTGRSLSEAESSAETYGTEYTHSDANSVEIGSSNGTEWGWNTSHGTSNEQYAEEMNHLFGTTSGSVTTTVGAEGSIPGFASVSGSVGGTVGTQAESGNENTRGQRTEQSSERGESMTSSENSSQTYGSTTTDAESTSMSGTYGVERQSSIDTSRSESTADETSTTYEMGGSASVSTGYEVGSQTSWEQSWVSTSEQSELLSYTGKIPNGRCAVIYRQTVRYVRTAQMYSFDLCGVRSTIGELTFNEWSWSPNIAIGDDCETKLPPSTQPPAECFRACE